MSKISNVLTMLEYLSSGKKYSINELAEKLEVTPRMIRIYKDELEKAGIYIDTIMGPYGGYVLNDTIRVPKRKFKKEDYLLIDKYIDLTTNKEDKEKLKLLRDKIKGLYIGNNLEKDVNNINDENQNKYNIFARAIKERRKVKILYYSIGKGENERIVHPLDLMLYNNEWFVSAFCELRGEIRHFDLKRVRTAKILDQNF